MLKFSDTAGQRRTKNGTKTPTTFLNGGAEPEQSDN
jgi:hypothetical protein